MFHMTDGRFFRVLPTFAVCTLAVIGLGLASSGCASSSLDAGRAANQDAAASSANASSSAAAPKTADERAVEQGQLEACYRNSVEQQSGVSVNTQALFFARGGKYIFVDVELPQAPELARCFEKTILTWRPFVPPDVAQNNVISGALAIRLGNPAKEPPPITLDQVKARTRRVTLEALRQGALKPNDAVVKELLSPAPEWPSAEQRAQLQACLQTAEPAHRGLVLHRDVLFLARGGRVLLADVSVPEAPELERCLVERIQGWPAEFRSQAETAVSSFFLHLGTEKEEFPSPPVELQAQLARRDALVSRAVQLGLVDKADPLLLRIDPHRASRP